MTEAQLAAFELRLDDLKRIAKSNQSLKGCLLAACSAHDADAKKQTATMRFLVKSGVEVDETDKNGVTPLHRAVRFRSLSAVKLLLALGADVNATDRRSGSTPLHRATTGSGAPSTAGKSKIALSIAKLLLANGADVAITNKRGKVPGEYAKSTAMQDVFAALGGLG